MELNLGLIVLGAFLVLALLRVPIYMALIIPCSGYFIITGISPLLVAQRMTRTLSSFVLLTIPLFIFVGTIMNESGVTDKIVEFSASVIGHISGGMAQINILTSLLFSGISGSALADIGGVGRVLIRAMTDEGYDRIYSAAVTSASATAGPIFPPSIPLILFGVIANTSVLSLLLAGALPAVFTTLILMLGVFYIGRRRGQPTRERSSMRKIMKTGIIAFPAVATPIVLILGMLGGFFSPTEAAAVTVLYILLINTVVYRITDLTYIWDAGREAAQTSGVILVIISAAGLFSWIMSLEQVNQLFANMLFSVSGNIFVLLILVNIMVLIIGLFMEPIAALVMITPIVVPPLESAGADPVHIGVMIVFNLMIGLLTPPLGLSIFITADIADRAPSRVIHELRPFYLFLIVVLLIITFVPELSLFLPGLAG
jgi:tripartite ATP-independent transporter DctM subunit